MRVSVSLCGVDKVDGCCGNCLKCRWCGVSFYFYFYFLFCGVSLFDFSSCGSSIEFGFDLNIFLVMFTRLL